MKKSTSAKQAYETGEKIVAEIDKLILLNNLAKEKARTGKLQISGYAEQALNRGAPKEELNLILRRNLPLLDKAKTPQKVEVQIARIKNAIEKLADTTELAKAVGNKTANLERLRETLKSEERVVVPPFSSIPHHEILSYVKNHFADFDILWKQFTDHMSDPRNSVASAKPILEKIQEGIKQVFISVSDFPSDEVMTQISYGKPIMVRSTGREDTIKTAGGLGGHLSVPNVTPSRAQIASKISEVVASYFSVTGLGQRHSTGDDITQPPFMPVLLQVMVGETRNPLDHTGSNIPVSGVMYTTEGELNTDGVTQISAAFGHAEGVVTGSQPTDSYYVQGEAVHALVYTKLNRRAPGGTGELETVENPITLRNKACLSEKQLLRLSEIGRKLESEYGYPLDIEWSYDPSSDIFYIFQARPLAERNIPEPTYLKPENLHMLENLHQVSVIGAAGGRALTLSHNDTLVSDSAPEALRTFLANPDFIPKAVIIGRPTAINSHEAGFFRQKQIPIIYLPREQFRSINDDLKNRTLLVDTAEGLIGKLPQDADPSSFITQGLRRHLAPKMESSYLPDLTSAEIEWAQLQLVVGSEKLGANEKNTLNQKIKKTFGVNLLDRLLNAYEGATSSAERDYILSRLIGIVQKTLLPKMSPNEQGPIISKIIRNAMHVRMVFDNPNMDDLNKKFAMNWLRAAILKRPVAGVIQSETLYTGLDVAKERALLNIQGPSLSAGDAAELISYQDIFERSGKFILLPESRAQWKSFISGLSLDQARELAGLFSKLGPKVVEIWINSSFIKAWNEHNSDIAMCLKALSEEVQNNKIVKALALAERCQNIGRDFGSLAGEFGNPEKFDQLLEKMDKELIPAALACLKEMKKSEGGWKPHCYQNHSVRWSLFSMIALKV